MRKFFFWHHFWKYCYFILYSTRSLTFQHCKIPTFSLWPITSSGTWFLSDIRSLVCWELSAFQSYYLVSPRPWFQDWHHYLRFFRRPRYFWAIFALITPDCHTGVIAPSISADSRWCQARYILLVCGRSLCPCRGASRCYNGSLCILLERVRKSWLHTCRSWSERTPSTWQPCQWILLTCEL